MNTHVVLDRINRPQGRVYERRQRILSIIKASPLAVTADRIASDTGMSVRSVYRYVADLQMLGEPVAGEAGVGYLWRGKRA